MTTQAKRETASFLVERWSLSVRQACRLVHLSRTVFHYQAVPNDDNEVREALRDLARKHPKGLLRSFGDQRLSRSQGALTSLLSTQ